MTELSQLPLNGATVLLVKVNRVVLVVDTVVVGAAAARADVVYVVATPLYVMDGIGMT